TLTPMLNARLVRKDVHKKSKFYVRTESFFLRLIEGYGKSLDGFLRRRWQAFPIIGVCLVMIVWFYKLIPSELAPLEDRNWLRLQISAPEGASFEYTDAFMLKLTD